MKLEDIFDDMENRIGWNLEHSFEMTYFYHKDFMETYLQQNDDDNNVIWCFQFMLDFLNSVEYLIKKGEKNMNYKDVAVHKERKLQGDVKRYETLLFNAIVLLEEQYSIPQILEALGMTEKEYHKTMGDD